MTWEKIKTVAVVILMVIGAIIIAGVLFTHQITLYDRCYNHNEAWACAKLYS